jgi:hypothetical protein
MRQAVLSKQEGDTITGRELAKAVGTKTCIATNFLRRLTKRSKCLHGKQSLLPTRDHSHRMITNVYTKEGKVLPKEQVTKGLIAELVWQVLKDATEPLREKDICGLAQKRTNVPLSVGQIHNVVFRWFINKQVVRYKRGLYGLRSGILERPVTTAYQ